MPEGTDRPVLRDDAVEYVVRLVWRGLIGSTAMRLRELVELVGEPGAVSAGRGGAWAGGDIEIRADRGSVAAERPLLGRPLGNPLLCRARIGADPTRQQAFRPAGQRQHRLARRSWPSAPDLDGELLVRHAVHGFPSPSA